MIKSTAAWLTICLITVAWASSLILAKIAFLEGLTPIIFVALRYTIACPFLIVAVYMSRRRSRLRGDIRSNWRIILLAGLTGPFLSQVLQYIGLSMTTASETILLLNMSPVFAVLMAAPVLKEKITSEKIGGLFLAAIGAGLIVLGGAPLNDAFDPLHLLGNAIVIVSTFLFAVNGIAGKMAVKSVDAVSLTLYSTLFAVPFIWLSATFTEDITVILQLSMSVWAIILWVGVVNTALAFILYYNAMNHIEASRIQIALNLITVWGVLMAFLVLGEPLFALQLVGGALTIIGVIIAHRIREAAPQA
ncbi:MAG: DMT family transporter [Candidatus Thorarchaeota archaeon]|nr:MAG: DMT family transporter [Candidatus Thorarchaeota archaeon]